MASFVLNEYQLVTGVGEGRQKKEAKMKAAAACLTSLREICVPHVADKCAANKHPVSSVNEFAQFFGLEMPKFDEMADATRTSFGVFFYSCSVNVIKKFIISGKSAPPSPLESPEKPAKSSLPDFSPPGWKEPPKIAPQPSPGVSLNWALSPKSPASPRPNGFRDTPSGRHFTIIGPKESIRAVMGIEPPFDIHRITE